MRFSLPVIGLCAAMFGVAAFAAPASAQGEAANAYVDHASSALSIESLGLNELTDPVLETPADPSRPLASHAMAPAFPTPQEQIF